MKRQRVFFYVQHLLGIGHLVRATRIARALAQEAFDVDIVLGGTPVPGLDAGAARMVQLPPVRSAVDFGELIGADGSAMSDAAKAARRDCLLAAFDQSRADILLIEAFPFGRSQMRFELVPLLERAHAATERPLVCASIRDILQRGRKPQRIEETAKLVEDYFDVVLVHGDPDLVRLEATFPQTSRIEDRVVYTGIVGPGRGAVAAPLPHHDVIVSAGGGAVGDRLIHAAIAARPMTSLREAKWLVVTGPNFAGRPHAAEGVEIVDFVADLPQRLRGARLSISQAGYNTVADLLAARCRSVLVPYAAYGESEQSDRARMMESRGLAAVLSDAELDGPRLAEAVERAIAMPEPTSDIRLDGAERTAAILLERVRAPGRRERPRAHRFMDNR